MTRIARGTKTYENLINGRVVVETDNEYKERRKYLTFDYLLNNFFQKYKNQIEIITRNGTDRWNSNEWVFKLKLFNRNIYFSYRLVSNSGLETNRKRLKIKTDYFGEEMQNEETKREPQDDYFFISLYPTGNNEEPICIIMDNDGVSYHPQQSDSSCWFDFTALQEAYFNNCSYSMNRITGNKYVCCTKSYFPNIMNAILQNDFTDIIKNTNHIIYSDEIKIEENDFYIPDYKEITDAKIQNSKPTIIKNPNFRDLTLYKANYQCELCNTKETFITNNNKMYFEAHHLIYCNFDIQKQFTKKLDNIANMYCLCANCHRKIHFVNNDLLLDNLHILYDKRKRIYQESYNIKLEDLHKIYLDYRKVV